MSREGARDEAGPGGAGSRGIGAAVGRQPGRVGLPDRSARPILAVERGLSRRPTHPRPRQTGPSSHEGPVDAGIPAEDGRIDRRRLLGVLGAGLVLPLVAGCGGLEPLPPPQRPGSRLDALMPRVNTFLDVTNTNTGDRVAVRFMERGRVDRRAMSRLDWVFRDWRENRDPEIDPRLYWALAALSTQAQEAGQSGRIQLLSGYRTKRTNRTLQRGGAGAASNSYHTRRRAADIRLDGVPMEQVAEWAEWLQVGGVGRYSGSNFTHIDTGDIRTWRG
jgi:uncharacterized protein YcbK (DUF882 family)